METVIVTGVAGFIGSSFVRMIPSKDIKVIGLDKLTYAGHKENIEGLPARQFEFVVGDIGDRELLGRLMKQHQPMAIVNFAAESHVDNSILGPEAFISTNINGVFRLLESVRTYWNSLPEPQKSQFRYLQVSTDEVFGSLGPHDPKFNEETPYSPNSPYSASKASADHLARAWHHTYHLPTIITNCSNNYGPRQFPEKLIPRMILNGLEEKPLPVYGAGLNIRDWIHVEDHCQGIWLALLKGKPGDSYCFGGNSERKNLDVVQSLCDLLDRKRPHKNIQHKQLITFVEDRAGHDFRYAVDDSKAQKELGYRRKFNDFEDGLAATVDWYLQNAEWIDSVRAKSQAKAA